MVGLFALKMRGVTMVRFDLMRFRKTLVCLAVRRALGFVESAAIAEWSYE